LALTCACFVLARLDEYEWFCRTPKGAAAMVVWTEALS
jgi:hypothetical protein